MKRLFFICSVFFTAIMQEVLCANTSFLYPSTMDISVLDIDKSGTSTSYSNPNIYIYRSTADDSCIYIGNYYNANELDAFFGKRTEKVSLDNQECIYRYNDVGVVVSVANEEDFGLYSFFLLKSNFKCHIEGLYIGVGDNITNLDLSSFSKVDEEVQDDQSVRKWYFTSSGDLLDLIVKNNVIIQIRVELGI